MLETSYKIIKPGVNLYLDARYASVETQDTSADMLEKACSRLRTRCGLPAVVSGSELLVLSREPLQQQVAHGDDWRIVVTDAGRGRRLRFTEPKDRPLMALLVERAVLIALQRRTNLWTLDSPRIWYTAAPFITEEGIAAYRRFEVSAEPIDKVGVGVSVHISTAFFTEENVSYFFREDIPEQERKERRKWFNYLSERQQGKKGTLLYDLGDIKQKCYFAEFVPGTTCGSPSTGFRLRNEDFESLLDYYNKKRAGAGIKAHEPVAKVSFQSPESKKSLGADKQRSVPVSADRLRLRVMNKVLPKQLINVDKIAPGDRVDMINYLWRLLGEAPLGCGQVKVAQEFWRPRREMTIHLRPPDLVFADGQVLEAPRNGHVRDHKDYYRLRRRMLDDAGCWRVPPAVNRTLRFAFMQGAKGPMTDRLMSGITGELSRWTGKEFKPEPIPYDSVEDAAAQIKGDDPTRAGVAVFVFEDDDPATYFNVAYELKPWRVKRITLHTLRSKFTRLQSAEQGGRMNDSQRRRAIRDWDSFIEMSALDVLQQLDCVPYRPAGSLNYEAHLAIDVGEDGRHFSLTLLICRHQSSEPSFWIRTVVRDKTDPKQETINRVVLRDAIVDLFKRARRRHFDPVASLLVLRDGRECGEELDAIYDARDELVNQGMMPQTAKVDVVDFHKKSLKAIRMWDVNAENFVRNVLEGTPLFLSNKRVVIANTGAATLGQGTADPVLLEARSAGVDMGAVAADVNAECQLNYSNPSKAQRLPLIMKRC
ncbi:MAG TPA: hypothetical protein VF634_01200, partial [Pyrinomonadaceae bacterium]